MFKLIAIFFALSVSAAFGQFQSASAQNVTCPTRPVGDNSNACASTYWVNNNTRISATGVTFTQLGTGAVQQTVSAKLNQFISTADFGAVCDGSTDDTIAIQRAGDAAIAVNKPLRIQESTNGCIVSQSGSNPWAILWTQPINIIGTPGRSIIRPATGMSNTVTIIYFAGSTNEYTPSGIDGVFIGNPLTATRAGGNAIVFDTTSVGSYIHRPTVRNSYIQQPSSGSGWSIFAVGSASNVAGGIPQADIAHNYIGSGVALVQSGDSIKIDHNVFSSTGVNPGIYASLITNAGNLQIVHNNISASAGAIVVDCAQAPLVDGNEIEQGTTNTEANNALVDLVGGNCQVQGAQFVNNEVQAVASVGNPYLLRVANALNSNIDGNKFATPVAYSPIQITAASTGAIIGAGNTFTGVSVPVADAGTGTLAGVNIPYGSGGASQVLKRTATGGPVTVSQLSPGELSTIPANTFLGNISGSTANPVAVPFAACSGAGSISWYTNGSGWSCHALASSDLPAATSSAIGAVKPDNSTITVSAGVISSTATTINGASCAPGGSCTVNASFNNSIGADINMPVANTYVDAATVAQGTSGTWFASATATLDDTVNASIYSCKLWDGTTVIASATKTLGAPAYYTSIALSGIITSPAGNIRISCADIFQTTGKIKATTIDGMVNATTISAFRIH